MKAGDRISDYLVDRELGEGGMGKVHLARHTVLNQQVAIKVLDPEVARKPGIKERFIQEANIQASLRHPSIVQVLTATQIEGGTPALVMEYIDGKSLSEVLELRGALPVDDALNIMAQVFAAVGYAHQQGVIHRDLKPSNVMVMANGDTKVTDFGIAKVLGSTKLTRTGTAMGSAHYMSPEQIRRPEAVDARSDIYSLGCVFYEVLTGRPPFGEKDAAGTESDFEIKTAHVSNAAPAPSTLNEEIPAWLDQLVMKLLQKEPEKRPSSCEEALEWIRKSSPSRAAPAIKRSSSSKANPEIRRSSGSNTADVIRPAPKSKANTDEGLKNIFLLGALVSIIAAGFFFYSDNKEAAPSSSLDRRQVSSPKNNTKPADIPREDQLSKEISQLNGDWYSKEWAYGYTMDNGKGYATITNSPNFEVGQEIVWLYAIDNNRFTGKNVYKDGRFYEVTATLRPDGRLFFEGEKNARWSMERISKTQLDQIKQALSADVPISTSKAEDISSNINDISRLNGDWYSKKWGYGYTLRDGKGYATITNSPNFEVGQEIVRLNAIGDNRFAGHNVYKDGNFYKVKVTLRSDGSLFFEGEKNATWTMERIHKTELDQIKRQLNAITEYR